MIEVLLRKIDRKRFPYTFDGYIIYFKNEWKLSIVGGTMMAFYYDIDVIFDCEYHSSLDINSILEKLEKYYSLIKDSKIELSIREEILFNEDISERARQLIKNFKIIDYKD